jgi:hypothetical protein
MRVLRHLAPRHDRAARHEEIALGPDLERGGGSRDIDVTADGRGPDVGRGGKPGREQKGEEDSEHGADLLPGRGLNGQCRPIAARRA